MYWKCRDALKFSGFRYQCNSTLQIKINIPYVCIHVCEWTWCVLVHVGRVSANVYVCWWRLEVNITCLLSRSLPSVCVHVCVCVPVCTCVWRPEFSIRSLSPIALHVTFWDRFFTEPGARMVNNKLHSAFFVIPPVLALHACMHGHLCLFMWVLGTWAQALVFPASFSLLFLFAWGWNQDLTLERQTL